ncbi:cation:proton antiporter [Pseudomaricurvus alkylphenolicus]|uniref:cation:proton antiporter n=1 Tax=Pseudomaricurvus alkylphenolicus TaxID=1306991 RepID=UPI0023F8D6F8|nr:cation:proton antiporter [Pseudomaricurvus alkylphenolicus]
MGQILSLCGIALGGLLIQRILRLDLTLASLLSGTLAAIVIPAMELDIGLRAHHVKDLVFFVFLPLLVFEAAWHIQPAQLKRWLIPALLLATLGLLISAFVTGVGIYLGINHPIGFPWVAAFLTGAILAATDPVAVIAKLKALKAPEGLTTLFEGESLFNDTTAVVLFGLMLSLALHQTNSASIGGLFLSVLFGGIAIGLVSGTLTLLAIHFIQQPPATIALLVFCAFGSFYVAEHSFHVSGIMAVMSAAMLTRVRLGQSAQHCAGVDLTWEWLGLVLNTLLFALMGLVLTLDMFVEQWLAMLIAIGAALLARLAAVWFCVGLLQLGQYPLPEGWGWILCAGGLRGGIAVALVLSLPVELPYWWTIQSMVFGVVLFSLLVQGAISGRLIQRLC